MVKYSSCRSSSGYSENSPQFFKIYFPDNCSQRLRIPPAFVKYFKGVPIAKCILKTSHSKTSSWCIDVNKIDNYLFFEKGWPDFVLDNSLEFGDFLVFCYTGDSEFYVSIFGKNNCPKEFPHTNTSNGDNGTLMHSKSKEKMGVDCTVEMGTTRMPKRSSACKFSSKKPLFETLLKPSYIKNRLIHIPVDFVKSYMSTNRRTAKLKYSNKTWVVNLIRRGSKNIRFSSGWGKFIADNTLNEGDVCRFQLIGRNDYAFNVAITRGSGTPNKAQATNTTRPSSNKEEGGKRTVEANIEDASSKFISNHPFFEITMSPTYVSKGFLNIPLSFRNNYMNKRRATAKLQRSNKWWEVNLKGYDCTGFRFCGGWNKFATENSLQVGDVCSFELINMEDYVLKVSIAKGVDNSNPSND